MSEKPNFTWKGSYETNNLVMVSKYENIIFRQNKDGTMRYPDGSARRIIADENWQQQAEQYYLKTIQPMEQDYITSVKEHKLLKPIMDTPFWNKKMNEDAFYNDCDYMAVTERLAVPYYDVVETPDDTDIRLHNNIKTPYGLPKKAGQGQSEQSFLADAIIDQMNTRPENGFYLPANQYIPDIRIPADSMRIINPDGSLGDTVDEVLKEHPDFDFGKPIGLHPERAQTERTKPFKWFRTNETGKAVMCSDYGNLIYEQIDSDTLLYPDGTKHSMREPDAKTKAETHYLEHIRPLEKTYATNLEHDIITPIFQTQRWENKMKADADIILYRRLNRSTPYVAINDTTAVSYQDMMTAIKEVKKRPGLTKDLEPDSPLFRYTADMISEQTKNNPYLAFLLPKDKQNTAGPMTPVIPAYCIHPITEKGYVDRHQSLAEMTYEQICKPVKHRYGKTGTCTWRGNPEQNNLIMLSGNNNVIYQQIGKNSIQYPDGSLHKLDTSKPDWKKSLQAYYREQVKPLETQYELLQDKEILKPVFNTDIADKTLILHASSMYTPRVVVSDNTTVDFYAMMDAVQAVKERPYMSKQHKEGESWFQLTAELIDRQLQSGKESFQVPESLTDMDTKPVTIISTKQMYTMDGKPKPPHKKNNRSVMQADGLSWENVSEKSSSLDYPNS